MKIHDLLKKIREEFCIRKVFFNDGKPFLHSFNERLYPKIQIDDKVKFVGILSSQLKKNTDEVEFEI